MVCYPDQYANIGCYVYNVSAVVPSDLLQVSVVILGNFLGISDIWFRFRILNQTKYFFSISTTKHRD